MKRVKNSDIKFKINKKLVYLPNFVIRFYTVNQKEYFFEKTQDDLVSYEREATVDDVEVILSGGTTVTEYYLPLNWSELLFVGQGILNYKLTNNIEDPEFPDYQYNKEEVVTTDFYIDSIKVDPEPDESLIERVIQLEEHLDEEIVNREEADAAISGAVDSEIARAISAETALDVKIDDEIERAISAETAIVDALEEEANRAISAETAIDAKIDQEIADRIADVNAEEARAISAETALDAKIDAETNRATSAETALQTAIDNEATARANADTALQTAITNEESRAREAESAITNALNAEVTRATGAEAALAAKIDTVSGNVISETSRATTAENALSGAIDSISAATSGSVEELSAKIDQEIADRTADVDAEETRAKGVEDVLSGAIDTIDAKFIDDAKYEMSGQTHVINFYNGNVVKATIDCTDFLVDGMIDNVYIENGYLVIDFNTASGKQDIRIPLTDIFNPANYYTKDETSGATELSNAFAQKLAISDFNTYSGNVATALSEKASQSTVDALNGVVTAHTADTSIHVTSNDKEKWNKVDEKADTTALTAVNDAFTAHTADTSIHLTTGDVQSQIDNSISGKVNVSDNVVSAYSFNKSTKIKYPDITAERIPSIPSGTKKISIGFTMLPANNQLFETLQFVTFNPFGFVDVASGLTVGVSEDMSTIPFTYTVTSVTWTGDDSIMAYDLSENDTLLNLYAQGDYSFSSVVPKGINVLSMYIDVLEDIESGQTAEVVNDGVIKNFENIGKYLQSERNRVDNWIDDKLDATAYTPVVSSIMQGSTNPVEGGTLWDELRVQTSSGGGETAIAFDANNYSTNYPLGCTSLKVNVGAVDEFVSIYFYNGSNTNLGEISVANFGGIEVTYNTLPGATYEISGNIVTLSYPAQGIVKIEKMYSENFSFSAVNPPVYTSLKSVVNGKQDTLVSGVNIKTINNESILGNGNIDIQGGGGGITSGEVQTMITSATTPIYQTIEDNEEVTAEALNVLNAALSGKADSSDVYLKSETSGATELATAFAATQPKLSAGTGISIDANNVISATGGGGGGISSAECQTMIDESISGKTNQSDFTGHTADTTIHVTAQDKTNWNNKSNFSGDYNDLTNKPTIPTVPTNVSDFTNDAGYITSNDITGKTNQSDFTAHTANTTVHVTSTEKATWNAKSDFSGSYNDLTDKPTIPTVPTSNTAFTNDAGYITANDITGKTDVTAFTAHTADTTAHVTSAEKATWNNKSDFSGSYNDLTNKLSAGTNITIVDNVISATGGGGGITSGEVQTMIDSSISGKTNQSDFTAHTANTTAHVTQSEKNTWNAKSDFSGSYNDLTDKPTIPNYTAGSGITISNNVISAKIWSGTQAQYDALAVKDNDTIYLIYNS